MKRFTETEKWRDPWFRKLEPRLKCLWFYLCDTCCAGGTIDPDWELVSFVIGEKVTAKDLEQFAGRIDELPNGKRVIAMFVEFQYGVLSPDCKAHVPVFKSLEANQIPYPYPKRRVSNTLQDKEKDKEKDQDKGKEREKDKAKAIDPDPIQLPESLRTQRMVNSWQRWMTYRRGMKKPGNWQMMFAGQIQFLSKFTEPEAHEVLETSMRNGWQGLFPPKTAPNGHGEIVKPNELRLSMEAKKTQAAELKQRYCAEGPLSDSWSDPKAKQDYFKLRREIKDLNARIASYS